MLLSNIIRVSDMIALDGMHTSTKHRTALAVIRSMFTMLLSDTDAKSSTLTRFNVTDHLSTVELLRQIIDQGDDH
jgi:hypothetical protein